MRERVLRRCCQCLTTVQSGSINLSSSSDTLRPMVDSCSPLLGPSILAWPDHLFGEMLSPLQFSCQYCKQTVCRLGCQHAHIHCTAGRLLRGTWPDSGLFCHCSNTCSTHHTQHTHSECQLSALAMLTLSSSHY